MPGRCLYVNNILLFFFNLQEWYNNNYIKLVHSSILIAKTDYALCNSVIQRNPSILSFMIYSRSYHIHPE